MKIFGKTVNFSEASNVVQCNSLELFTSEQSYLHMPLLHGMQRQQQTPQIRLVIGLQASLCFVILLILDMFENDPYAHTKQC